MIPSPSSSLFRFRTRLSVCITLVSLCIITGCARNQKGAGQSASALEVNYLAVKSEPITVFNELPGRTSPHRIAEVRARINGIVQKRLFTEGSEVNEGDVLFEIDPAPYQATLDSARAGLSKAEADLKSAKLQAERFSSLVETNAISQQTYDDAVANELARSADVDAARAAVQLAGINLGYTRVTSPISGRIGRAEVTEGAYVQQSTATLMAVVQQLDPLYVDLEQSVEDMLQLKHSLATGQLEDSDKGDAVVTVILSNGDIHPEVGLLQFSDVSVNPTTGMVTLRALVPNPGNDLLPGMFVRARIEEGTDPAAILVPQSAVSRNNKGEPTAYVVGSENKAELRNLRITRAEGNRWLVEEGLHPGDHLIVSNLQRIRPGVVVNPSPEDINAVSTGSPGHADH